MVKAVDCKSIGYFHWLFDSICPHFNTRSVKHSSVWGYRLVVRQWSSKPLMGVRFLLPSKIRNTVTLGNSVIFSFKMGQPTSAFLQREFVSQLNGKTMLKPITSVSDLAVFNIRADTLINAVESVLGRSTLLKRRSYIRKYAQVTKYPLSVEAVRSVESLIFRSVDSMLCSSLDHSDIKLKQTIRQSRLLRKGSGADSSSLSLPGIIWSRSIFNQSLGLKFGNMQAGRKKAILGKPY